MQDDILKIGDREFKSRFLIGTGKFSSPSVLKDCIDVAESEIVTVAMRRVDLDNPNDSIMNVLDPEKILILPNTSGAVNAEEAIRLARIAKATGLPSWLKLEITPDPRHLLPDPIETLKAAEVLVKEGFTVLPYMPADPILAKRLEEVGCAAVMPLAAPIGTNKGLLTQDFLELIIQSSNVPVVIDAGLGSPSHVAAAMEMGADAILANSALAAAGNPVQMTLAFKMALDAGRIAYKAGLAIKGSVEASSPVSGFLKKLSDMEK